MDHETTLANSGAVRTTTFDNAQGDAFVVKTYSLAGGTDDYVATNAEIATAYEKFNDAENVDLSLLICGPCLLYTSPSPRDRQKSRMPSSA